MKKMKKLHGLVLSGLSAVQPPINHDNQTLDTSSLQSRPQACSDWTYRADFIL